MSLFITKNKYAGNRFKGAGAGGGAKKSAAASKSVHCVNPVFEKWIVEWRDEAAARELNSRHIYTKVCSESRIQ